jgi:hypothetical protein
MTAITRDHGDAGDFLMAITTTHWVSQCYGYRSFPKESTFAAGWQAEPAQHKALG